MGLVWRTIPRYIVVRARQRSLQPLGVKLGSEAIVPIHWQYPIPKPDAEKDVSAWTETIQERFQTAYAGMRERQQQMGWRNAQYYKLIQNQFNIGQWVWIFDPRIIPGSCDKLNLC